jgi:predicted MFS family arabinose efflux permease
VIEPAAPAKLTRAYVWYALALLAFGNLLNYLDRSVIFALFEPIKNDLHVTDTQLGWLGSVFAIVFALGSLVAGVLSDLLPRRLVIAGGLAAWSGFTALGGLARTYWQLFSSRAIVGVTQSSYLPAAQALLADYFPDKGRAQAMGIFWSGLVLGGVLAVWVGGLLASAFGWRSALLLVGLPGVLFAGLLARLRDPWAPVTAPAPSPPRAARPKFEVTVRHAVQAVAPLLWAVLVAVIVAAVLALVEGLPAAADTAAFLVIAGVGVVWTVWKWARVALRRVSEMPGGAPADVVDEMLDAAVLVLRTPTLVWMFLGGALTSASMNSLVAWSLSFVQRELGLDLAHAGRQIGMIGLAGGVLGSWAGGRLGDRLMERWPSGRVIASASGFLIGTPLCVALLLTHDIRVFSALFFAVVFLFTWYNGPVAAVLFDVVPRKVAATVMGAYVFFIHIAGDAVALPVVGFLSDRYGLRAAMLTLPAVGLLGGLILLISVRTVGRDMARVRQISAV